MLNILRIIVWYCWKYIWWWLRYTNWWVRSFTIFYQRSWRRHRITNWSRKWHGIKRSISVPLNLSTLCYILVQSFISKISSSCVILCQSLNLSIITIKYKLTYEWLSRTIDLKSTYTMIVWTCWYSELYIWSHRVHHPLSHVHEIEPDNVIISPLLIIGHRIKLPFFIYCWKSLWEDCRISYLLW